MVRLNACLAILVLFGGSQPAAQAAKIKVWQQTLAKDFDKAQFKGAVVSSEGALRLARVLKPLADLKALHVWAMVEDKNGKLFVASGDEGKLFTVGADGKVETAYTSPDSQILSLAVTPEGTVFAGTGPGGNIIRLAPGEKPKVIADSLGSYVWSLAYDEKEDKLLAGTGPKGRIYQVTPRGKAEVYLATRQEHVLSLAGKSGGPWFAGTDKGGLVYRLDGPGKSFVLYQAAQGEIRSLAVQGQVLYAGTSSPVLKRGGGGKAGGGALVPLEMVLQAGPAPVPPPPQIGENSVYRLAPDGSVRELFRDKLLMLSLLPQPGRLLVGTGMNGQLIEIDEGTREKTELARLDHGQILTLLQRRDGSILLGTGDSGKLYTLEKKFTPQGIVTSEVLDAKIISRWGALTWKTLTPPGTQATLAVRSGNVAEPDATWSNWSAELIDPAESKATCPKARYLQYRVTLTTTNPAVTPEVRHLALRYQTTNQAPEITSLEVPDLDLIHLDNPRKFKIKWNATDPNEDELTYSIHLRKDGWRDWLQLEKDLEKREYDWDTTAIPSGLYQIKVVANDGKDNPPEEALSAQRISGAVPVANTPPAVALKLAGWEEGQAILEGSGTGTLVRIAEAAYAVDGKRWTNVFPVDGLFDGKVENFRFKVDLPRPGMHVVVLRVRDAAGNVGAADVVFTVPAGAKD